MFARINSMGLFGMDSYMVQVEADLSQGLPRFDIVGLPDAAISEAKNRVRSAIKNTGFAFPVSRITVNLAPADTRKEGSVYDLPILMALLKAGRQINFYSDNMAFIGVARSLLRQGRDSVALRRVDSPIRRNDILFYRRPDGSFVLHRVKAVTEAALSLWGDNQTVPEEGVSPDWVIGRVTRIFRDDKEVTCDGMGYRLYLLLWQFTITRGFLLKLCHLSERRNAL